MKGIITVFILFIATMGRGQIPNLFDTRSITSPESLLGLSPTMGILDEASFPYISTVSLGWIYVDEVSTIDSINFWHEQLGWVYTRTDLFPTVYLYTYQDWALLDLTDASQTKYFRFKTKRWHFLKIKMYDAVPESLRGIEATNFNSWRGEGIRIGMNMVVYGSAGFAGYVLNPLIYNPEDGCFYPTTRIDPHENDPESFPYFFKYRLTLEGDLVIMTNVNLLNGEEGGRKEFTITNPQVRALSHIVVE